MVETLRLVLELCPAGDVEVGTVDEETVPVALDDVELKKDPTSIVFVVVTTCGEEDVEAREAVTVVEATGAEMIAFTPFNVSGPGGTIALGR
jgi:hypothetical protein